MKYKQSNEDYDRLEEQLELPINLFEVKTTSSQLRKIRTFISCRLKDKLFYIIKVNLYR